MTDEDVMFRFLSQQLMTMRDEFREDLKDVEKHLEVHLKDISADVKVQNSRIEAIEGWRSRQSGFIAGVAAIMSISVTLLGVLAKWLFIK